MLELITQAIDKGANLHLSISGGKDGQAMANVVCSNFNVTSFIHADLGRVEWPESLPQCIKASEKFNVPLHVVTRKDGRDLLQRWNDRLDKLKGTGKPFWSSLKNRYCTSDLKRDVIDLFFRNCGDDFIISCEGIRADESPARSKKIPLEIRRRITSSYYDGMTVEEAIENYQPGKRLALTWYPIFNFTIAEVWATENVDAEMLDIARIEYKINGFVPAWWPFHPAYVYGNDRVSCMFCIVGSLNDLQVAAQHNPGLLNQMIEMEIEGGATFKENFSLTQLL